MRQYEARPLLDKLPQLVADAEQLLRGVPTITLGFDFNLVKFTRSYAQKIVRPSLHTFVSVDKLGLSVGLSYRTFTPLPHQDCQAKGI